MAAGEKSPIIAMILGLVKFGFNQKESVQKLNDPSATIKIVSPRIKENKTVTSILNFRKKKDHNTPLPPILLSFIHATLVATANQQLQNNTAIEKAGQMKRVAMIEAQRKAEEKFVLMR